MTLRLLEGEPLHLQAQAADFVPADIACLIGSVGREVRTRGDGACALHAAFSTLGISDSLQVEEPRSMLRAILGHRLDVLRGRVRPAQQGLVEMVLTTLWEDALEYNAETQAARNEESLVLSHLHSSPGWNRVLEAIGRHLAGQDDFD